MRAKVCLFIYLTVHLFAQEEVDRTRGVWKPFPSKYLISGPGWSECRRKEELCWPSEWKRKLLAISHQHIFLNYSSVLSALLGGPESEWESQSKSTGQGVKGPQRPTSIFLAPIDYWLLLLFCSHTLHWALAL